MSSNGFSPSRRAVLRAAIASASIGLTTTLSGCVSTPTPAARPSGGHNMAPRFMHLDEDARALWRALLADIGRGQDTLAAHETAFLQGIDQSLNHFSLHNQQQLQELFSLLALAPSRWLLTGHWKDWNNFSPDDTYSVMERWRTSRLGLLNQAYAGLTRLGAATLYAQPDMARRTGYPGPPERALNSLPQFRQENPA